MLRWRLLLLLQRLDRRVHAREQVVVVGLQWGARSCDGKGPKRASGRRLDKAIRYNHEKSRGEQSAAGVVFVSGKALQMCVAGKYFVRNGAGCAGRASGRQSKEQEKKKPKKKTEELYKGFVVVASSDSTTQSGREEAGWPSNVGFGYDMGRRCTWLVTRARHMQYSTALYLDPL